MEPKILLIDDDVEFTAMLSEVCSEKGFRVFVSHTGREGLIQALSEHPDIVVCDYFMPEMTGADVARELRTNEWGKNVPILLLTNMSKSDITLDETLGVECLLKTDVMLDEIATKAKALLAR